MNAHPRLPLAALAASLAIVLAIVLAPATPVRAAVPGGQPVYESAPRSARIWHPADPYGYAQLKWITGTFIPYMGAADDTLAAGYTALVASNAVRVAAEAVLAGADAALLESNAVRVAAEAVLAGADTALLESNAVLSARCDALAASNAVLVAALGPVPSFPMGDLLFSDGTNLFYISADLAYTNALTTNTAPE